MLDPRYAVHDTSELLSPSLLIYPQIVRRNIEEMIKIAGGGAGDCAPMSRPTRWPRSFVWKSRSAYASTSARRSPRPKWQRRPARLMCSWHIPSLARISSGLPNWCERIAPRRFARRSIIPIRREHFPAPRKGYLRSVPVLVDLDIGMGRTGIQPGESAAELYALVNELPNLAVDGLHAYDGHIHETDVAQRRQIAQAGVESALALRDRLLKKGLPVPHFVVGGTPTFPIHAELDFPGVECSPGTPVLYDYSYLTRFPDLPFTPAALAVNAGGQPSGPGPRLP